jgi:NADH dehydrogenase
MTNYNATPKVVVIGGGYSGTLAANHLRMRADSKMPDITLVNPRPKFVERIRLHQFVAGNYDATVDYGSLLGDGIKLVVDTATCIDSANRTVQFASGRKALDYDYLIYAVGSTGTVPASVPGAAEFAYPIAELEQAQRLRAAIDSLHPDAPVIVVGAGLTGIEAATELAEQGRKVTLVCGGQLGPSLGRQGDGQAGDRGAGDRRGDRGPGGCGGLRRRRGASECGDDLDGGFRRSWPRRRQRAAHR